MNEQVVIVGGTGQIGAKLTSLLRSEGFDAIPVSPSSGVDAFTGAGLEDAVAGAHAVIDVSKPRTYDPAVLESFFSTSADHLLTAERAAGVRHHIGLAAVGTERHTDIPFYRAKALGEDRVRAGGVPYSLVHATQFFEFLVGIADSATADGTVSLPDALVQPIAGDDVAHAILDVLESGPGEPEIELAGPEIFGLPEFVERGLAAAGDPRRVIIDAEARYFGGRIDRDALLPGPNARIGPTSFASWLGRMPAS